MSTVEIANAVRGLLLESGAKGWAVEVSDQGGWTITLTHPASHGLVLATGTREVAVAIDRAEQWVGSTDEIHFASAAPGLTHSDLVLELRGLSVAFEWQPEEMSGVVRMLESHDVVSADEADWLAPRSERPVAR